MPRYQEEAEDDYYTQLDNDLGAEQEIEELHRAEAPNRYAKAKAAKIGDMIGCPQCDKPFKKASYQQVFCTTPCKDKYWNTQDPVRRLRTTRFQK